MSQQLNPVFGVPDAACITAFPAFADTGRYPAAQHPTAPSRTGFTETMPASLVFLPTYLRLLERHLTADVLDVDAILAVAQDAARDAIRGTLYDHALAYAEHIERLATPAADDLGVSSALAVSRAFGIRGQVHLRRGDCWRATADLHEQLSILTRLSDLDTPDALDTLTVAGGLAERDTAPGGAQRRGIARDIALCRIDMSFAQNEIGDPQSARNHADYAETALAELPRDPINTARARVARIAATITTAIGDDIHFRRLLTERAHRARAVFTRHGAVHDEERALRVIAALTEPVPAWAGYRSQVRADAQRCQQLLARMQTDNARFTETADRITTALSDAVSRAAAQRRTPPPAG